MKEFIEFIVKKIVTKPDDVVIDESIVGTAVTIKITVNEEDMGLLIGKSGKTIRSIRAVAKAKAIKDDIKVFVETC